jgi:hypothetical protein
MPEQAVTTPVVPVVAPPTEYKELSELTETQDAHWRMTGELPEKATKEAPKPKADEKETPAEAKTAEEPGTAAKLESERKKKPTEMGYGELRSRVKELEEKLAASSTAPKESAPVEEPTPNAEKVRTKPTQDDKAKDGTPKYKSWEEFNEDLIDWHAEKKFLEYRKNEDKAREESRIAAAEKVILDSWNGRVTKASEKYPDFAEVALDKDNGPGSIIGPGSVVDAWILDSEFGADILYHFGKNRSDLERYAKLSPLAAARELTRLEAKLSGEPAKTPPAEEIEEPEPKTTKTPPPAREVGGRGSAPVDEVRKAVDDDDTGAYMEAMNRRDIASRLKR